MNSIYRTAISAEALLAEVDDLIRSMPPRGTMGHDDPHTLAWVGRATAVAHACDPVRAAAMFDGHVRNLDAPGQYDLCESYDFPLRFCGSVLSLFVL